MHLVKIHHVLAYTALLTITIVASAGAQDFVLKFESAVGQQTAEMIEDLRLNQDFDFDGDGTAELVTRDWGAKALFAYSLPNPAPVWSLVLPDVESVYLAGFYDFDGDGNKEALVDVTPVSYEYEIRVYSTQTGEILLTLENGREAFCQDLDGDTLPELIVDISNPVDIVQVWGAATSSATPVVQNGSIASTAKLAQNHPNPFNPQTVIRYEIQKAAMSSLRICDAQGRCVRTLFNEYKHPGAYSVAWDGKGTNGRDLASGLYFYQLQVDTYMASKRMIMLR